MGKKVNPNGSTEDPVAWPSHYNQTDLQPIQVIEKWDMGFHLGNAIKYIARAGKKDPTKTIQDLKKAIWYIERQIQNLERGDD